MAEGDEKENHFPNSSQIVVGINKRLPPPGGEDMSMRMSKMQLSSGATDSGNEEVKSVGKVLNHSHDEKCGGASEDQICPVCCQPYVHPVELPCTHIFCYLCVKGVLARKPSCPFCRATVPRDFVLKPKVVEPKVLETAISKKHDSKAQWYYEGRTQGWWLYDPRTSEEIEEAYNNKKTKCVVQVAGFNYVIDFEGMIQFRQDRPERKRKILRSNMVDDSALVKGVAGLYSKK